MQAMHAWSSCNALRSHQPPQHLACARRSWQWLAAAAQSSSSSQDARVRCCQRGSTRQTGYVQEHVRKANMARTCIDRRRQQRSTPKLTLHPTSSARCLHMYRWRSCSAASPACGASCPHQPPCLQLLDIMRPCKSTSFHAAWGQNLSVLYPNGAEYTPNSTRISKCRSTGFPSSQNLEQARVNVRLVCHKQTGMHAAVAARMWSDRIASC